MTISTIGDVLKDEGIEQVLINVETDWQQAIVNTTKELLRRKELVTGEDIRLYCQQKGVAPPHHCNAWGAVTQQLRRLGFIVETDRTTKAMDPKGHSRRLVVWKSKLYRPADLFRASPQES